MSVGLISHPDSLLHEMGRLHPEQPARIKAIEDALIRFGLNDAVKHYTAPLATRKQLLRVHTPEHIDNIFESSPKSGLKLLDPDTAMNPHTLNAALHAAGANVKAVDLVMAKEVNAAFCNIRPPGHHAERDKSMGFCFFNNVAVGVAHALEHHRLKRVAIIDFDVHHGNGTEDIFKNDERVLFCSSFEHPFYPFSGAETRNKHIINVPLVAGSDGKTFRQKVEEFWFAPLIAFNPEMIFFSAGFDAYIEDEMSDLLLSVEDYAWITREIKKIANLTCHGRIVSTLEGGYSLDGLGRCVTAHIQELL